MGCVLFVENGSLTGTEKVPIVDDLIQKGMKVF